MQLPRAIVSVRGTAVGGKPTTGRIPLRAPSNAAGRLDPWCSMSFGLLPLLLRLLLGALLLGDAIQKPFGWFRGQGPTGTGVIFRGWGVRSGKQMTLLSSVSPLLRRRQVLAAGR